MGFVIGAVMFVFSNLATLSSVMEFIMGSVIEV
jgi:hypothetical protein